MTKLTRRSVVVGGASTLMVSAGGPALAQAKQKLRFSSAFTETDLRAEAYKAFAAAIKDDFDFEPYWGNTLFKQGTELVALQRDNLELCNLAPADISKQIPAWSLLTSAYLFRDADHLKKTFKSDVGQEFIKMAKDQLGIQIITPVYFGARSVNLKPDKTDQHAGRHGGHQAAHAARRILAVPRRVARRQSDAGRLCRALHGAADRHGRRPGQSARRQQADEVRRGDDAVRPHPVTSSLTT